MRQLLSIILLVSCAIGVAAQEAQLDDLMEHLAARGVRTSVSRVNDKFHLSRRYNVTFDNDLSLADSICRVLDGMARHAVESYRYESHRNGNDTITYSIAMRGYGTKDDYVLDMARVENPSSSWTNDYSDFRKTHSYLYPNPYMQQEKRFFELLGGNNRKMYFGAREAVMFDYVQGHGNIIAMSTQVNETQGMYYHFDISPLDSLLNGIVDSRPVHYSHASGAPILMSDTYYFTDYLLPKTKGKSDSRGHLYIVNNGADFYQLLLNAAKHHLDMNPTQCCVLEYTNRHFKLSGIKNTTKYRVNDIAESAFLMADLDKDGKLYLLRLDVDGEYWIPKNWKEKETTNAN